MAHRKSKTKYIIIFCVCIMLIATAVAPWISKVITLAVKEPAQWTIRISSVNVIDAWKTATKQDHQFILLFDGLIFAGLLWLFVPIRARLSNVKGKRPTRFAPPSSGNNEHGSARFLTPREMDRTTRVWYTNKPLTMPGDVVFGQTIDARLGEKVWLCNDEKNTIIIGSTGSGKTRRFILPSIYAIASSTAKDSMFITDTKGELVLYTKDFLEEQGYNIINLDFRQPKYSQYWNPIEAVMAFYEAGDIPSAEQAAVDTATIIVEQSTPKDKSSEPFWNEAATSIIAGLILLMVEAPDDVRNMSSVYSVLGILGIENNGKVPLSELMDALPQNHPAFRAYRPARLAPPVTRGSMFASTLTNLRLFADTNVAEITSRTSFDLDSVSEQPTAIFITTPEERSSYNALASIFIAQLWISLTIHAIENGGVLKHKMHFILDEFGNIPAIPDFTTKLTTGRSRGIKVNLALQGIDQLERRYGRTDFKTILGNCENVIYLRTAHYETAKYISDRIGKYTIRSDSESVSQQGSINRLNSGSSSESSRLQSRELIMPEELTRWEIEDGAIVLRTGEGGVACFPMPDISEWSANEAFGMGDRNHNQKLLMERAASLSQHGLTNEINIDAKVFYKKVVQKYVESIEPAVEAPTAQKGGRLGDTKKPEWKAVSR